MSILSRTKCGTLLPEANKILPPPFLLSLSPLSPSHRWCMKDTTSTISSGLLLSWSPLLSLPQELSFLNKSCLHTTFVHMKILWCETRKEVAVIFWVESPTTKAHPKRPHYRHGHSSWNLTSANLINPLRKQKGTMVMEGGKWVSKIIFFSKIKWEIHIFALILKTLLASELNVPGIYSEELEQIVSAVHTLLLKTKILFVF